MDERQGTLAEALMWIMIGGFILFIFLWLVTALAERCSRKKERE